MNMLKKINMLSRVITSISDVALLTLEGSALFGRSSDVARLFNVLANKNINAILITQGSSEHSISFAVNPQEAKNRRKRN